MYHDLLTYRYAIYFILYASTVSLYGRYFIYIVGVHSLSLSLSLPGRFLFVLGWGWGFIKCYNVLGKRKIRQITLQETKIRQILLHFEKGKFIKLCFSKGNSSNYVLGKEIHQITFKVRNNASNYDFPSHFVNICTLKVTITFLPFNLIEDL